MLNAFVLSAGRLMQVPALTPDDLKRPEVLWVDMVDPTDEERELVQRVFRLELPEDEELLDLEESARCYMDDNGLHISSFFLHNDGAESSNVTVSFLLNEGRLLTIRQEELAVIRLFRLRARVQPGFVATAQDILLAIYDAAVEYDADVLEDIYAKLDEVSRRVLDRTREMTDELMGEALAELAGHEDTNGKVRLDLMDTRRALSFLLRSRTLGTEQENNLREILRDLESLNNHSAFLFEKINFLMDAVMGLINLAQNKIIKIFSIASVVFLPPTLVASIYGMNFAKMPELAQDWGYPAALVLMVISGIAPYWFFKRKGWL
ncbi:magnesium/cobalt transporter CorA [Chitinilyticum aquatile]|uniref:magnesium/cobalt transporter CorA n=1 Tax=Chitinilyticum aquatile TaxID=362520 RepID=UPI00041327E3|nr:magnesium/cobalt transporter CorA [Chitinilyticum aquatile]